jgi:hypothetical protein
MEEVEGEVKRRGLGEKGRVAKSENSLVVRIPKEIDSLKIKRDQPNVIYPSEPRKLIIGTGIAK